ncbi:hypothetical protein ElyMa_002616600 [Elysia marginata]|uniref:Uncharacterized protein n=1 Tax=Elysia marginata TaxID=1093978 RepID=A0AAV4H5P3_9GAST|nr:hypothetical protein ElyMa_002616600 [Elysia marginata]
MGVYYYSVGLAAPISRRPASLSTVYTQQGEQTGLRHKLRKLSFQARGLHNPWLMVPLKLLATYIIFADQWTVTGERAGRALGLRATVVACPYRGPEKLVFREMYLMRSTERATEAAT